MKLSLNRMYIISQPGLSINYSENISAIQDMICFNIICCIHESTLVNLVAAELIFIGETLVKFI